MERYLYEFINSLWQGSATRGSLSKEDAAFICVEALDAVPEKGLIFEVCLIRSLFDYWIFEVWMNDHD